MSVSVGRHSRFNPGNIIANLSVNTRITFLCTSKAPGNNTLKLTIADDWTTGIPCTDKDTDAQQMLSASAVSHDSQNPLRF